MPRHNVYPANSCVECNLQAAARCPTCRNDLCMEHFPLEEHEPCARRMTVGTADRICYVCGVAVMPHQWSVAHFAHYIDSQKCAGCGRFICDGEHTRVRGLRVKLARDGIRSARYHVTTRYCDVCAPVRRIGGLVGLAWWGVILSIATAAAYYLVVR